MPKRKDPDRPGEPTEAPIGRLSRRGFLKGAGLTMAAVGVQGPEAIGLGSSQDMEMLGTDPIDITLSINGTRRKVSVEPRTTLLDLLRDQLEMTGSKRVCNRATCGACTVLVDGRSTNACTFLAIDGLGAEIRTIEGLAGPDGSLSPIQDAFVRHDATQCGFCTPGMIMSCTALVSKNPHPTREEIKAGLSGNICRCGTYQNIFEAVEDATRQGGAQR
ncbi:MAG TPA: (2Fe-2S)-binding protein [Planctomycetes bacterium]|nr:(2Fe-2S)-binding protein [Planctomycetota bacterium]